MAKHEKYDQSYEEMQEEYENWRNDFDHEKFQGIVRAPEYDEEYDSFDIESYLKKEQYDAELDIILSEKEKEAIQPLMEIKNEVRNIPEIKEKGIEMIQETITVTKEQFEELRETAANAKLLETQMAEMLKKQNELTELLAKIQKDKNEKTKGIEDITTRDMAHIVKRDAIETANKMKEAALGYAQVIKDKVINVYRAGHDKIVDSIDRTKDKTLDVLHAGQDKVKGAIDTTKEKALQELNKATTYYKFQTCKIMSEFHLKMEQHYERKAEKLESRADYIENVAKSMNQAKTEVKNLFRALMKKEKEETKELSNKLQEKIANDRNAALSFKEHANSHRDKIEQNMDYMNLLYAVKEMSIDDKIKEAEAQVKEQNGPSLQQLENEIKYKKEVIEKSADFIKYASDMHKEAINNGDKEDAALYAREIEKAIETRDKASESLQSLKEKYDEMNHNKESQSMKLDDR